MSPKHGAHSRRSQPKSSPSSSNSPRRDFMMPIAPGDSAKVLSTYQGYPGTFDYDPRTPDGGSNMTLDYGQHLDHGQGIADTWGNNSMNLLSGAFPANQVTSSSLPLGSSSAPTHGILYSQTASSYIDNGLQNIPLENIIIQRRSDERCTWPGCGMAFQDLTRLSRHQKTHSAPDQRECELCHALVTGKDGLERHYRRHVEQTDNSRLEYYEGARDKMTENTRK